MNKLVLVFALFGGAFSANANLSGTALIVDGDAITISGSNIRLNAETKAVWFQGR